MYEYPQHKALLSTSSASLKQAAAAAAESADCRLSKRHSSAAASESADYCSTLIYARGAGVCFFCLLTRMRSYQTPTDLWVILVALDLPWPRRAAGEQKPGSNPGWPAIWSRRRYHHMWTSHVSVV